jgi:hypothetical protein
LIQLRQSRRLRLRCSELRSSQRDISGRLWEMPEPDRGQGYFEHLQEKGSDAPEQVDERAGVGLGRGAQ